MKITDKEQRRIEQEQSPEGRRKARRAGLITLVVLAVFVAAACLLDRNPEFTGEPYIVSLGDVAVIPGETEAGELAAAGYDFSDHEHGEWVMEDYSGGFYYEEVIDLMEAEADAKSYYRLILVKDGIAHGYITIENSAGKKIPVTECKVRSIEVHCFDEGAEQTMLAGVAFSELSEDALTQSVGAQPESAGEGVYTWKKGRYAMTLTMNEEGMPDRILSEYTVR